MTTASLLKNGFLVGKKMGTSLPSLTSSGASAILTVGGCIAIAVMDGYTGSSPERLSPPQWREKCQFGKPGALPWIFPGPLVREKNDY